MQADGIEEISIPHLPSSIPIYAALYRDVTNASFLREQLLIGNAEFEYAFIEAKTIVSRRHALAAVFRAMNDYLHDRLKSRNIHSEIVFSLSPNNNIGEAFRRFGISDTTKNLLVFKMAAHPETITRDSVQRHLEGNIQGTLISFNDENIKSIADLDRVKKIYKLGAAGGAGGAEKGGKRRRDGEDSDIVNGGVHKVDGNVSILPADADERKDVETQVLGLMALRGAT